MGTIKCPASHTLLMDPVLLAVIILGVSNLVSEILPFTPLKGNGIAQLVLQFMRKYAESVKSPE